MRAATRSSPALRRGTGHGAEASLQHLGTHSGVQLDLRADQGTLFGDWGTGRNAPGPAEFTLSAGPKQAKRSPASPQGIGSAVAHACKHLPTLPEPARSACSTAPPSLCSVPDSARNTSRPVLAPRHRSSCHLDELRSGIPRPAKQHLESCRRAHMLPAPFIPMVSNQRPLRLFRSLSGLAEHASSARGLMSNSLSSCQWPRVVVKS
ncbi:hypothetical protein BCR34DRAFT_586625 [Clohesyomyces aquaticus]|uniref:Uncharacterized protein n=1 Tax=Clohesyomyces aquaticus TaxID=1231657 RepID=A0A1Y1ZSQ7_9PLEO|nr:hypothetical protein BCR34DRAFT_586625 [Clohesyomyces aquaticus]